MTDFSKCEIGTKVICLLYGEGVITAITDNLPYVIAVNFIDGKKVSYTKDGYISSELKRQCLYLSEEFPLKEEPEYKIEPAIIKWINIYKMDLFYWTGTTIRDTKQAAFEARDKENTYYDTIQITIQPERKFKKVITWEEVK